MVPIGIELAVFLFLFFLFIFLYYLSFNSIELTQRSACIVLVFLIHLLPHLRLSSNQAVRVLLDPGLVPFVSELKKAI